MKWIVTILIAVSFNSFAEDGSKIQEKKAKAIQSIDARIKALGELKSCISSASKKEDLKACRKKHKDAMKPLRTEMKQKREKRKAKREANQ